MRRIWLGADQEFVGIVVGKREAGRVIRSDPCSKGSRRRATALPSLNTRDVAVCCSSIPWGNFWTMASAVRPDGSDKVRQQFELLRAWGLNPEGGHVTVWLPAGFKTHNDPPFVRDFSIRTSDLEPTDLADLVGVHLLRDPQGAAISDAYEAVVTAGWASPVGFRAPNVNFGLTDLIEYLDDLRQNHPGGDHGDSTIRALIRSLRSLERSGVFANSGTPLTALYAPGRLNILMLPHRVGADLRRVITRLILRRTLREREKRLRSSSVFPSNSCRLANGLPCKASWEPAYQGLCWRSMRRRSYSAMRVGRRAQRSKTSVCSDATMGFLSSSPRSVRQQAR